MAKTAKRSGNTGGRNGSKKGLNDHQRNFMGALQAAVNDAGGPATVPGIVERLGKSDSRVRSHLKKLIALGYVCCVKRAKRARYVPSSKWVDEPGVREANCLCVGGECETPNCTSLAEAFFCGKYVCRGCMMGERDDPHGRKQYYERLHLKSAAGDL